MTVKLAVKYKDLNTLTVKDLLFHPHSAEKPGTSCCKTIKRSLIVLSDVGISGREYLIAVNIKYGNDTEEWKEIGK